MVAGRELDAYVAEKVMGRLKPEGDIARMGLGFHPQGHETRYWSISTADSKRSWYYEGPQYSTDIAAAWEVVEKMHSRDFSMMAEWDDEDRMWFVGFSNKESYKADEAATAPLAICLAALKAVE